MIPLSSTETLYTPHLLTIHNSRYSCVIMVLYKHTHNHYYTVCEAFSQGMDCLNEFHICLKLRQLMVITSQDQERVKWP